MNNIAKNIINRLAEKPKTLFLIDGLGAILTAFFLYVAALESFNEYFGMPVKVLTYLSAIASCFCIYSSACFFFLKETPAAFIKVIGTFNLLYCALTMALLSAYYPILTIIGTTYFLVEIAIICGLSYIELKVATKSVK